MKHVKKGGVEHRGDHEMNRTEVGCVQRLGRELDCIFSKFLPRSC